MANENKTVADIIAEWRGYAHGMPLCGRVTMTYKTFLDILDRLEVSYKREAQSIERIVRDAIIDYNEMYPSAPNDEAERDLRERAARANAWLKQHGFEEELVIWSKEETPCL